jgi:hypothetical protein
MNLLSTKNIQRLLFLILFLAAVYIKMYMLLASQILYYLSFEYLNLNAKYLKMPSHKNYNWFFISFVVFVVLVRADIFGFSDTVDYHFNTAEHLFFSGVMCLMILVYLQIFKLISRYKLMKLLVVFAILNLLGLVNEFFQNLFQERPFFSIEGNDIKDMIVNLIGSSLFVTVSLFYKRKSTQARKVLSAQKTNTSIK